MTCRLSESAPARAMALEASASDSEYCVASPAAVWTIASTWLILFITLTPSWSMVSVKRWGDKRSS